MTQSDIDALRTALEGHERQMRAYLGSKFHPKDCITIVENTRAIARIEARLAIAEMQRAQKPRRKKSDGQSTV